VRSWAHSPPASVAVSRVAVWEQVGDLPVCATNAVGKEPLVRETKMRSADRGPADEYSSHVATTANFPNMFQFR
jgi:hypothetical protein